MSRSHPSVDDSLSPLRRRRRRIWPTGRGGGVTLRTAPGQLRHDCPGGCRGKGGIHAPEGCRGGGLNSSAGNGGKGGGGGDMSISGSDTTGSAMVADCPTTPKAGGSPTGAEIQGLGVLPGVRVVQGRSGPAKGRGTESADLSRWGRGWTVVGRSGLRYGPRQLKNSSQPRDPQVPHRTRRATTAVPSAPAGIIPPGTWDPEPSGAHANGPSDRGPHVRDP